MSDHDWLGELLGLGKKRLPESPLFHPGDLVEVNNADTYGVITRYYWNPRHFIWEYLVFFDGSDTLCGKRGLKLVQSKE